MTTTTARHRVSPHAHAGRPAARLTFAHVVRSEWIKATGLRATWISLASIVLIMVVFGVVSAAVSTGSVSTPQGGAPSAAGQDPVTTVLLGANFAVLLISVLGALTGAREYSSGMIANSFAAVPRRLPVLWGKAVTFIAVALPACLVGVLGAFTIGMAILSRSDAATASLTDGSVAQAVFGEVGYLVGIGLIGLFLGVLVRNVAGSLGLLIGGILILPQFAGLLLPDSWNTVLKFLPSNAGSAFSSVSPDAGLLGAVPGALVFAGWVILAFAGASVAIRRRDV